MNKRYIEIVDGKIVSWISTWENPDPTVYTESEVGELGQLLQPDGSFVDDPVSVRKSEISSRINEIKVEKEKYDLGVLTSEQYEPLRLELIDLYNELETL